jgi:drug/metabolite transporter (DMT)-like permease
MIVFLYIFLSGILGVTGQIILKRGLAQLGPLTLTPDTLVGVVISCALNPLIVIGLAVTVSGTFFWLIALSRVDLSFAYPFASLNYVFVLAGSWLLLGEALSPVRLIGVLAICAGVCLVARTPHRSPLPSTEEQPGEGAPSPFAITSTARRPV